jgi:L,D-transpeptidase-like protein
VKRILAAMGVLAIAALSAACSAGTTEVAAPRPVVASSAQPSSPAAPTTTPSATTSTTPPPVTSSTSKTTPQPKPKPKPTTTAPGVPCAVSTGACVDLSAKKAWLLQDGKVTYGPVPIASGRKGYATPTGMFHVISKEKMHLSHEFDNAPMPNSVFFYPGDAFHTGSLSDPSHGCIHLSSTASLKFFTTLQRGQAVQIVP